MGVGRQAEAALLYLATTESPDRPARSVVEISDAVGVETDNMADRVGLLSSLRSLESEGLVESSTATVEGKERTVFRLTAEGEQHARDRRDQLRNTTVDVHHQRGSEEIVLAEADRFFDDRPLVRALAEMTDDGVVYLEAVGDASLVDRDVELDRLSEALSAAADGRPTGVSVVGEPGIGKTTLLDELARRADERGFQVLRGGCRNDGGEPFEPLVDAVEHTDIGTDWLPEARAQTVDAAAADDARERIEAERTATIRAFRDRVESFADDVPVALVVNDIHQADRGTGRVLTALVEELDDTPVLLAVAGRQSEVPEGHPVADLLAGTTGGVDRVRLDALDRSAVGRLLCRLVGRTDLPGSFVDAVYEHTGGNPLFVEESVAAMRESGSLDPDRGIYPEGETIPVPDAVEETVFGRLATLDEGALTVLSTASVLGESFDRSVLAQAVDVEGATVDDYLDLLVDARFFRQNGDQLRFDCGVLREAIYDRLDDEDRRRRHRIVAEALGDRDAPPARTAKQFEQAGDRAEAIERYVEAGEQARAVYAHEDAIDAYEQALRLAEAVDDEGPRATALRRIGWSHFVLGRFDEASKYFEYLRSGTDDRVVEQRTLVWLALIAYVEGDLDRARELAHTGLELPVDDDRPTLWQRLGWIAIREGEFETAVESFDRQLDCANDDVDRGSALHGKATVATERDDLELAREKFERAMELFPEDQNKVGSTINNLAVVCRRLGDVDAAEQWCDRGLDLAESLDHRRLSIACRMNKGNIASQRGRHEEAIEHLERVTENAERIGDRQLVAHATTTMGRILVRSGRMEDATGHLEAAREHWTALGNDLYHGRTLLFLAKAARRRGAADVALEHADAGLDLLCETSPQYTAPLHAVAANAELDRGNVDDAAEHATAAVDRIEALQSATPAIEARLALGRIRRAQGRHDDAADLLSTAAAAVEDVDDPYLQARCALERGRLAAARDENATGEFLDCARSVAEAHGIDRIVDAVDATATGK